MRRLLSALLLIAATLVAVPAFAQQSGPLVIASPAALEVDDPRPRIFLAGSIGMGAAPDWQAEMTAALSDLDVVILNPRRPDWNPAWRPESDEPEFRRQVEWELAALETADVVVMYFSPESQAPISLLEMGLYARTGRLIVFCPPGFWRKGNVDITADYYGVQQVDSFEALIAAARERLAAVR